MMDLDSLLAASASSMRNESLAIIEHTMLMAVACQGDNKGLKKALKQRRELAEIKKKVGSVDDLIRDVGRGY